MERKFESNFNPKTNFYKNFHIHLNSNSIDCFEWIRIK